MPTRELLGHNDVKPTAIYAHVDLGGGRGVKSPLDIQPRERRPGGQGRSGPMSAALKAAERRILVLCREPIA